MAITDPGDGRLRLTVLGGYLGSGKTTWLRHHLHARAFGPQVRVFVNEAAETPVDDALLAHHGAVTLLAGGCCCCTGSAALILALRDLCDLRSRDGAAGPERAVLETSGLADPGAILAAVQSDSVLVHHIRVEETIVLVDALHGLAQLATDPLGRRQAEAADRLILTKVDAVAPEALDMLRATLAILNPGAEISAAALGDSVALPPLPAGTSPLPLIPVGDGAPLRPTQVRLAPGADWSAFTLWLSALLHARGEDIVRVKGVIRTPAGRLLLQSVRKVVQSPEILPGPGDPQTDDRIVFIGRGYRAEDLPRSLHRFLNGPG